MNREQALVLLKEHLTNKNLIKHCLAVEAVMRALALHFSKSEELWGLAGLLHDIDYEQTKNEPAQHSLIGAEMLQGLGLDKEIVQAVKTHNEMHNIPPEGLMAGALFVTDPLTGLIVAATLVSPSKKIAELSTDSIMKRFKEGSFARGANREIIGKCEEYLQLELEVFAKIGLEAMQAISEELGL